MLRIVDTIAERGRHATVYGERGVGKTSLMQVVPFIVPSAKEHIRYCRVQAFPNSTFHSLFQQVFKRIKFNSRTLVTGRRNTTPHKQFLARLRQRCGGRVQQFQSQRRSDYRLRRI